MSIRGKGAEIALGLSSLTFVAGVAADVAAEHFDVNQTRVEQLTGEQGHIKEKLNGKYPKLEAMLNHLEITVKDADELGTNSEWFALHNQLGEVGNELTNEQDGSRLLNVAGRLGEVVGRALMAGSLFVLSEKTALNKRKALWDMRETRRELDRDYDLERKAIGLVRPNIPWMDISDTAGVLAFTADEPVEGLSLFAKRVKDETRASVPIDMIKGFRAEDKYDTETLYFMKPLFGTSITKVEGGWDMREFGDKLEAFVERCAELRALEMKGDTRPVRGELDPLGDRFKVSHALRLLDEILPLDQDDIRNPACDVDPDYEHYGRHWVDFVDQKARSISSKKYPIEV